MENWTHCLCVTISILPLLSFVFFVKLRVFFFLVMLGIPAPVGAAPRGHLTAEGPAAVLLLPTEDGTLCPLLLCL